MIERRMPPTQSFAFPFLDRRQSSTRLRSPVVMPILATFRFLLESTDIDDLGAPLRWRNGFEEALDVWEDVGAHLVGVFYAHMSESGQDVRTTGKSPAIWQALCNEMLLSLLDRPAG